MIQIALSEYLAEIDQLIEDQRFVESIAHCRHILQQHPRHVGTYRMLGKALLEQQNYHDAADVFQRVLSADPEDFIAHVGMSIINKEDTLLPQAVWHMERAQEMDPYNLVIRDELLSLYEQRDERLPKSLILSRSALARLYVKSEMYSLAAAELRQLLAEDDGRMDLMTLLAETLWHAGQRVDAVDVCLEILERLPNSIKANAILAEVWLTTGRGEEANEFLDVLQRLTLPEQATLDEDALVATVFVTEGAPSLPQQQMVDYLDYVAEMETSTEDIVPQWVDELNLVSQDAPQDPDAAIVDDIPTPLPLTDVPSWFDDLADEVPAESEPAGESTDESSLDWLRDVAVARSETTSSSEEELLSFAEDAIPLASTDEIVDEVMASSPSEDIPDWLGGILAEQDSDSLLDALAGPEREEVTGADDQLAEAEIEADDSAWNDWDNVNVAPLVDDGETLTWLDDEMSEASPGEEEESFTWLENSAAPVLDAAPAAEENFDWLDEPDSDDAETEAIAADVIDEFDWIDEGSADWEAVDGPAGPNTAPAETADSLSDMADEPALSGSEEHFMDLNDKPGNEDENLPSESESSSSAAQQPDDDALDWLQDLADAEKTHTGLLRSPAEEEQLPDWLTQDMAEGSLPKELPDWLAEDALASGSDLSATVTDHEMIIPDVDRGTGDLGRDELPDEIAGVAEDFVEDEVEEDLSWLDAMSPVDEPPTLSWADSEVGSTPEPAPTEEPPTPQAAHAIPADEPAEADEVDLFDNWQEDTARISADEFAALQAAAGLGEEDPFSIESPSDAEIAMDWLDELSDAPEMALPDDVPAAPVTEIVDSPDVQTPSSAAPVDDMDWLEDLSAELEIDAGVTDMAELAADFEPDDEALEAPSSSELTWLDELSEPILDVETGEALLGPDDGAVSASGESVSAKDLDSAEVMAWLDELSELPDSEVAETMADEDLLPDLLGSAVELPVAEMEVSEEGDSDAMAWLDQLATEFADEGNDTPDLVDAVDVAEELSPEPSEAAPDLTPEMTVEETPAERATVVIDGQEVPDLDMEPTEDPLSEADAMAWLADLIEDETGTADVAMATEPADEPDELDEVVAETPPPRVIIDGQEVPDLDIEPTEDPLSEADAMAWLEDLIDDDLLAGVVDDEAEPAMATDDVEVAELEAAPATVLEEPVVDEEPDVVASTPQVVVDGQVVPDLDIEPTDDPLSEADAMAWLDEFISEVDQAPQAEALPDEGAPDVDVVTAVAQPIEPVQPDAPGDEAEFADEGLAALAFLEELAVSGAVAEEPDEVATDEPAIEPAPNTVEEEALIVSRAQPTEPEISLAELADEIPEDPDEAMDWIRSMAEEEPEVADDEMDMSWLDAFDAETDEGLLEALADEPAPEADEADLMAETEAPAEEPVVAAQESPFGSLDLDNMPIEDLFDLPDGELPADIAAQMTQGAPTDSLFADEPDAVDELVTGAAEVEEELPAVDLEDLFADDAVPADLLAGAAEDADVATTAPEPLDLFGELDTDEDDLVPDLFAPEDEVSVVPAFSEEVDDAALLADDLAEDAPAAEAEPPALAAEVNDLFAEDAVAADLAEPSSEDELFEEIKPVDEGPQPIAIADLPSTEEDAVDTEPDLLAEPSVAAEVDEIEEPAAVAESAVRRT